MAFHYFNGCQGDAQIWLLVRLRPRCCRTQEGYFDWTLGQQRRFRSGVWPLQWRAFPSLQRKEKEVHWPRHLPRDVYSPHQVHFSGSDRGHQIRSGTGITRGGFKSSFSHPLMSWRILNECHDIPKGWSDFYYPTLCVRRDSRPLDHQALLYGCINCVRSIPSSCG